MSNICDSTGLTRRTTAHFPCNISRVGFGIQINYFLSGMFLLFCQSRAASVHINFFSTAQYSGFRASASRNTRIDSYQYIVRRYCRNVYVQKAPTIPSACAPYRMYHGISSLGPSVCPGLAIRPASFSENDCETKHKKFKLFLM